MGCWSGHTCDTTGAVYILHSTLVFCTLMASKLCVINLCEQVVVVHINSSSSQSLCVVLEACVWFRAASLGQICGHICGHIRGRMCGHVLRHLLTYWLCRTPCLEGFSADGSRSSGYCCCGKSGVRMLCCLVCTHDTEHGLCKLMQQGSSWMADVRPDA